MPAASTGVSATAFSPPSAPLMRSGTRWAVLSIRPAGTIAFCRASESKMAWGGMPSAARRAWLNSTKIFSSWMP